MISTETMIIMLEMAAYIRALIKQLIIRHQWHRSQSFVDDLAHDMALDCYSEGTKQRKGGIMV